MSSRTATSCCSSSTPELTDGAPAAIMAAGAITASCTPHEPFPRGLTARNARSKGRLRPAPRFRQSARPVQSETTLEPILLASARETRR
ncbi:hypothetical protein BQ8482_180465 [Mesorhizobium delmotii]|uniref:Uncharacterized protein n=1 Tax=Mesorhizobium delmotii TaxID=1631247 RepID=A0A2P9AJC3_9HYPH|nr:hypothetical protein BQ8482_180465 [Mesorhizobium delmotii]